VNEERRIEIEEVSEAPSVPKARVADAPLADAAQTFERKRDYLEGFLAQQPAGPTPEAPGGDLYEAVIEALREIYDPEIPVNIYDLGLIYDVEITPEHHARVKMTLTTPHCPVADSMPGEVELVWDPPWDPQKMSDEAKLELGML
jgi:metal-sulfur cluster biosynthetic enzyme